MRAGCGTGAASLGENNQGIEGVGEEQCGGGDGGSLAGQPRHVLVMRGSARDPDALDFLSFFADGLVQPALPPTPPPLMAPPPVMAPPPRYSTRQGAVGSTVGADAVAHAQRQREEDLLNDTFDRSGHLVPLFRGAPRGGALRNLEEMEDKCVAKTAIAKTATAKVADDEAGMGAAEARKGESEDSCVSELADKEPAAEEE